MIFATCSFLPTRESFDHCNSHSNARADHAREQRDLSCFATSRRIERVGDAHYLRHGPRQVQLYVFCGRLVGTILDGETALLELSFATLPVALSSQSARTYHLVVGMFGHAALDEDYTDASNSALVISFGRVGQVI